MDLVFLNFFWSTIFTCLLYNSKIRDFLVVKLKWLWIVGYIERKIKYGEELIRNRNDVDQYFEGKMVYHVLILYNLSGGSAFPQTLESLWYGEWTLWQVPAKNLEMLFDFEIAIAGLVAYHWLYLSLPLILNLQCLTPMAFSSMTFCVQNWKILNMQDDAGAYLLMDVIFGLLNIYKIRQSAE